MRLSRRCLGLFVLGIAVAAPAAAQTGGAATAASGTVTIGGKAVPLANAAAFDAGSFKIILITESAVPRDKIKSEMDLMRYNFEQKPAGLVLWLNSTKKLTRAMTMSAATMVDVTSEIEVALAAGSTDTLSGTVKSKPAATKVKVDAKFNASTKP
jgi:hypothetical protein